MLAHKPGWGIDLDPQWLALSQHQVSYCGDRF